MSHEFVSDTAVSRGLDPCLSRAFVLDVTTPMQTTLRIYLDHNATTGLSNEVKARVHAFLEEYGNPSSIHWAARGPKTVLRETRQKIAQALGVGPLEIIFTSGGSEGNNTILKGVFEHLTIAETRDKWSGRHEFITTKLEHPSIMKSLQWLEKRGAVVHYLDVTREGRVDLDQYRRLLSAKTALVSVMFANNETGVLFPIRQMVDLAHAAGALFHSDCVQGLGKVPLNLSELDVDYATFSAHKFYSLKGTGFIYVKKGSAYENLIHGGGQERQRRGGTENTVGIAALNTALDRLSELESKVASIGLMRDEFEARCLNEIPRMTITSGKALRVPNTSSLVIEGVDGETLLMSLDLKGFAVSTGAACSSGNPEPSPVLLAIGLSREEAQSSLRVSLGWDTTREEMESFFEALRAVVIRIRSIASEGAEENVS